MREERDAEGGTCRQIWICMRAEMERPLERRGTAINASGHRERLLAWGKKYLGVVRYRRERERGRETDQIRRRKETKTKTKQAKSECGRPRGGRDHSRIRLYIGSSSSEAKNEG